MFTFDSRKCKFGLVGQISTRLYGSSPGKFSFAKNVAPNNLTAENNPVVNMDEDAIPVAMYEPENEEEYTDNSEVVLILKAK